ncbi:MAG: YraN family protein [Pseudomonadota bacterium]
MSAVAVGTGALPIGVLPGALDLIASAAAGRWRASGSASHAMGVSSERSVRRHLHSMGYVVLGARLRTDEGEIDILALRGRTLAVVEVKAGKQMDRGAFAVTTRKQRRLAGAIQSWLASHPEYCDHFVRFDVALCDQYGWCDVIENAFFADETRQGH